MMTSTSKDAECHFDRLIELDRAEPLAIVKRGRRVLVPAVAEYDRPTGA